LAPRIAGSIKAWFNFIVNSRLAIARLVTISTDNRTKTYEYRKGVGAYWPFLSDEGRIVQKISTLLNTPILFTIQ